MGIHKWHGSISYIHDFDDKERYSIFVWILLTTNLQHLIIKTWYGCRQKIGSMYQISIREVFVHQFLHWLTPVRTKAGDICKKLKLRVSRQTERQTGDLKRARTRFWVQAVRGPVPGHPSPPSVACGSEHLFLSCHLVRPSVSPSTS